MEKEAIAALVELLTKDMRDRLWGKLNTLHDERMTLLAGLNRLADHCANDAAAIQIIRETLNAVVYTPGQGG